MDFNDIAGVGVAFIRYQLVFRCLAPQLSKRIFTRYYEKLTENEKLQMTSGIANLFNSFIVIILTVLTFLEGIVSDQPMWGQSKYVTWNICNGLGYMLYDLHTIMFFYKALSPSQFIIYHHLCCVFAYSMQLYMGTLGYFTALRVLSEAVQPFLTFRIYLLRFGMKNSKLFAINGIALTVGYFLTRILIIPIFWRQLLYSEDSLEYYRLYPAHLIGVIVVSFIFDLFNFYWFSLILKGIYSILRNKTAKKN